MKTSRMTLNLRGISSEDINDLYSNRLDTLKFHIPNISNDVEATSSTIPASRRVSSLDVETRGPVLYRDVTELGE